MKKFVALSILLFLNFSFQLFAQSPQAINYQAVLRDDNGNVMTNQSVTIQFEIHDGNNIVAYKEEQSLQTNQFGLFTAKIGEGTIITGLLDAVNWGSGNYYLKVSLDDGNGFVELGDNHLVSVPYALHAKTVDNANDADADPLNEIQQLSLIDDTLFLSSGGYIILPTGFSGDYSDLSNAPNNLSDFTNDLGFVTSANDADSDSTNELQLLSISNDTVFLTDGGFVVLPSTVDTDDQTLILTGTDLEIVDGNTVSFAGWDTDASDDFSGDYTDLTNAPSNLSDFTNDLGFVTTSEDADADSTNELQLLSLSGDTIFLTDGGFVVLPAGTIDTDDQTLTLNGDTISIADGNFIVLSGWDTDTTDDFSGDWSDLANVPTDILDGDNVNDADADSTNELQLLSLSGDTIYLTDGGFVVLPSGTVDTDDQTLNISNDSLIIQDGNRVDLSPYLDNTDAQVLSLNGDTVFLSNGGYVVLPSGTIDTDDQTLSISGDTITIADGNFIVLSGWDTDTTDDFSGDYTDLTNAPTNLSDFSNDLGFVTTTDDADADSTNELQLLSLSGDTIYLTDGGFVVLPSGTVDTDDQTLNISNDSLIIQDGNRVDLSPYLDNTDAQVLSLNGDTVFLSNGGYVVLPSGTIDTDDQTLSISGDTISIADGNSIILSGWDTDTTDDFSGDWSDLANIPSDILDGDDVNDADADSTNELQLLSLSGDTIYLTDGGFVVLPSGTVDTDDQTLNISNDSLIIQDGNRVDLSPYLDNTDAQVLSLNGDTVFLSNGGYVVLPSGTIDTDDQTLSISGDTISIADGNFIVLSGWDTDTTDDFSGDWSDLANIPSDILDGDSVGITTETDPVFTASPASGISSGDITNWDNDLVNDADADSTNELQVLSLSNDTIYLTDGGFVVLPSGTVDTDDQTLTLTGKDLEIADGNTVSFTGWDTDTTDDFSGDYTDLTNAPTNLSDFSNDLGFVATSEDADADSTNELQLLSLSGDTIYLTDGGYVVLPSGTVDTDDQTLTLNGDTISIADGNFIVLSGWDTDTTDDFSGDWSDLANVPSDILDGDNVNDTDADSTNELQLLSLSGDTIYLTDGGFVVLPSGTVDTDDQTLSISNDSLIIQDGNRVDLSPYLDNTDAQVLSLNGDTVFLSNGGYVVLPSGTIDTDDQTLSISGDTITIADGNFIVLSGWDTDTADDFSGDWSDLANVPSDILDGDNVNDADADSTNELQLLSLSGDTIYLTDGGFVVLPSGTIDTDDQTLSISGDTITIADGNFIVLSGWDTDTTDDFSGDWSDLANIPSDILDGDSVGITTETDPVFTASPASGISNGDITNWDNDLVDDADADSTNELQLLSLSGDTIYLTDGGFVVLPSGTVDTDDQTLSISNDSLIIQDGNRVDLSPYLDNTDAQVLSLNGDTVFLSNGGFVVLPSGTIDTDDQTLSISGDTITIADGNFIVLSGWDTDTTDDFSGDWSDLANIPSDILDGDSVGITTETDPVFTASPASGISSGDITNWDNDLVDDADADSTNELQVLSLSNDTIYLTDGGFVVLPSGTVDTDDQTLTLTGEDLEIADGNTVSFTGWDTDTTDDFSGDWSDLANIPSDILDGDSVGITTETDPVFTASPASGISSGDITNWDNDLVNDADADSTNELQVLSLSNDTIYLTDGGFVVLPSGTVDTDDQTLTLTGEDLEIADGNTVSFTGWDTDTTDDFSGDYTDLTNAPTNLSDFSNDVGFVTTSDDADADSTNELQVLSLSNDTIYLTDGGFVVLPAGTVDTDDQTLTLTGEDLEIVDGNTVSFTGWDTDTTDDFSGDYTDMTNAPTNLSDFSNDLGFVTTSDDADADSTNELQVLSLSNDTIYLTDGGFVVLPAGTVDTDDQTLTLTGEDLEIADGNTVSFTGWDTDTTDDFSGDYTDLTNAPTNLSDFSNDLGFVTTSDDADADSTNELQVLSLSNDTVYLTDGGFVVLPSNSGEFTSSGGVVYNTTDQVNDDFVFGSDQLDNKAGTGDDKRFFFDKGEGAFRAGASDNNDWNSDSLGTYSFATGYNTNATGMYSSAFGYNASASGAASTSFGWSSKATGLVSSSIGYMSKAFGNYSASIGYSSTASGNYSIALGYNNLVPSFGEVVVGINNETYTPASTSSFNANDRVFSVGNGLNISNRSNALTILKSGYTGLGTVSPTTTLHVDGGFRFVDGNQASNYILASDANGNATWVNASTIVSGGEFDVTGNNVHNTTDLVSHSFVFGSDQFDNQAGTDDDMRMFFDKVRGAFRAGTASNSSWDTDSLGTYSFATGYNTNAKGLYSFSAGSNSKATNYYSIAMGNAPRATGHSSVSIGTNTAASGQNSTALGYYTIASGSISTAIGRNTTASGHASVAMGDYTVAPSYAEVTLGSYPIIYTPLSTTAFNASDRLFTVANGASAGSRSNALTILKSGYTGLGTVSPTTTLHVDGGFRYVDGNQAANYILASDASGNATWVDPASVSPSSEFDTTGNVVHNTSDMANHDFVFGSDSINNKVGTDDDARFFFDKSQGAFRAGYNDLTYWDEDSLGTYSSAFGYRTRAKGMYSFAAGRNTQAIGVGATALGSNSIASGSYSLATGSNTEASGLYSFAGGFNTNATGSYSLAMGYYSDATGSYSSAFGFRNLASGNYATAFGNFTDATGAYSSSFGSSTLASGTGSSAFGYNTDATGSYSTAFGNTTLASGSAASAFGYRTNALGNNSVAIGYYADAYSFSEVTVGMYPDTANYTPTSSVVYSSGDRLFSVANGRANFARSNAITVLKNGNVGIGTTTPARGLLEVSGYTYSTASTPTPITTNIGGYRYLSSSGTGTGFTVRQVSIYASNDVAAFQFDAFSDKRIKNIKGISDAKSDLNTLSQIQITDYTLIDSIGKGDKVYKKVIAQQVKEVYPQAVSEISDYIPNIYTLSEIKDGWINLDTDLKVGDNVKLIFAHGDELLNVEEVSEHGFRVNFDKDEKVFVFGKLVDDFHTVDYESISMLNVSATQELLRMVAQLQQKNAALENTLNEQEASLQNQMQMNNQQQAQIDKIMELLEMSSKKN